MPLFIGYCRTNLGHYRMGNSGHWHNLYYWQEMVELFRTECFSCACMFCWITALLNTGLSSIFQMLSTRLVCRHWEWKDTDREFFWRINIRAFWQQRHYFRHSMPCNTRFVKNAQKYFGKFECTHSTVSASLRVIMQSFLMFTYLFFTFLEHNNWLRTKHGKWLYLTESLRIGTYL